MPQCKTWMLTWSAAKQASELFGRPMRIHDPTEDHTVPFNRSGELGFPATGSAERHGDRLAQTVSIVVAEPRQRFGV
jgi:hypothetical protein